MEKLLTITIPSYNTEKFMDVILPKLVSVKQLGLLEVLVIDDGSKDNTAQRAKFYENRFPNSIRVITKKNGGHGSAINTGIANATGKYFKVVDADDWLDTQQLDEFIKRLKTENVDIIYTPFNTVDAKNGKEKLVNIKPQNIKWDEEYAFDRVRLSRLPSIHCYSIKTSLLKNNNILIDENAFYVDVEFILYPLVFARSFKFIDLPMYYYQINQTQQSISITNMKKNKGRHLFVLRKINEFMGDKLSQVAPIKRELIVTRMSQMVAAQFKIIVLFPISKQTLRDLKVFRKEVADKLIFDFSKINLPIKILLKSNFYTLPAIHFLAIIKMKLVHV